LAISFLLSFPTRRSSDLNLKNLLRGLCDNGMTAFISTHILEIAEQMCDRIGIIAEGQIIALGTMDELRQHEGNTAGSLEDIFLRSEEHTSELQSRFDLVC